MSYNTANLEAKLSQVTETQDSIQGTSQWILFHKRHAADAAATWARFVVGAPENLKLGLVYVANEVVQQAKNKGRDAFVAAWSEVLPGAIGQVYGQVPPPVQDRITRVIKVWRDRRVFGAEIVKQIEAATGGSQFFGAAPAAPSELQAVVTAWQRLGALPPRGAAAAAAATAQLEALERIEAQFAQVLSARRTALEALTEPEEEASPAIEADSEPEVYTAGDAQDEDEDEPAPAPAPALDPKLMSFLASIKSG